MIDRGAVAGARHGVARSDRWPAVRKAHLAVEPACVACGGVEDLQVHHMRPFDLYPELELDPTNLITLCEETGCDHHLLLGHLGSFESWNPSVRADCELYRGMTEAQIEMATRWLTERAARPMEEAA